MTALPSPRRLLAELVRAVGAEGWQQHTEPLAWAEAAQPGLSGLPGLSPGHHPLLGALHVLFPALLLPALDLLDRGRLVRWTVPEAAETSAAEGEGEPPKSRGPPSGPLSTRPPTYQIRGDTPHVVHLRAWHCTCAYFALRAAEAGDERTETAGDERKERASPDPDFFYASPPCRHLLACLLAEQWPSLRTRLTEEGSAETLAGVVGGLA